MWGALAGGAILLLGGLLWLSLRREAELQAALARVTNAVEGAPRASSQPLPRSITQVSASCLSRDDVLAILHDGQHPEATPPPAATSPKAEPSPESVEALQQAQLVVSDAVSAGTWREQDVEKLRSMRSRLSGEQMESLAHELAAAINSQHLRVEVQGSLF